MDTANFQVIELPEETNNLSIEILSVYDGEKWPNDTYLNIVTPFGKKP